MTVRHLRAAAAAVVLPVGLAALSWLIIQSFRADLPDPVATHWGASGTPDSFSTPSSAALTSALLAGGLGLGLGVFLWAIARRSPMLARSAGALAGAMAGFIGALGVGSLWVQRGLSDAHRATDIGAPLGIALAVAVVCAVAGGLLMPGQVPGAAQAKAPVPASAPRLPLGSGERAMWLGWAHSPTMLYLALGSVLLPLAVLAVLGISTLPILGVFAVTAVLITCTSTFRVTVGGDGLRVRSIAGWPRFHVPLDQVAEAEAIEVSPFREFGGWGLRGDLKGRFGVILRTGAAIEVRRGDGSRFIVTVDGADQAAALMNSLVDRARAVA